MENFAGGTLQKLLQGAKDKGKEFAKFMQENKYAQAGVGAAMLGGAGGLGYVGGKLSSMPSEEEEYSRAAALVANAFPTATPEQIDYEANRILYDNRGDMTPLVDGGSWEEFQEKQAAMAASVPLDSTGMEVGYM